MITTNSLLGAVVGTPISQSLSPAIYRAAFSSRSLEGEYEAIEADGSNIRDVLEQLRSRGVKGLSVTMPLKEAIIPCLDAIDDDVRL